MSLAILVERDGERTHRSRELDQRIVSALYRELVGCGDKRQSVRLAIWAAAASAKPGAELIPVRLPYRQALNGIHLPERLRGVPNCPTTCQHTRTIPDPGSAVWHLACGCVPILTMSLHSFDFAATASRSAFTAGMKPFLHVNRCGDAHG